MSTIQNSGAGNNALITTGTSGAVTPQNLSALTQAFSTGNISDNQLSNLLSLIYQLLLQLQGGETPGGETPGGETPGGETPGGETPGGEIPGGEIPGGETPGGETPGGETPGGETPGGETPGGETPGGETPGGETPGGETPGGETPGGETPGGETPSGETPGGETPGGETPGGETPGGETPGNPAPTVTLTDSERNVLSSLFAATPAGEIPEDHTLTVQETNNANDKLSTGDTVIISDADGNEISSHVLSDQDMYDIRFRENMVSTTSSIGAGWSFTNDIVKINNAAVNPPEQRTYTENDGSTATETVLERNEFWEVVQRGQNRYMIVRQTDDDGNAVKSSDAINDVFNNRSDYRFDCATPMPLINLKATLDTIGADDFDRNASNLVIGSWYDQFDNSSFDGGFVSHVRLANAGDITVNGVSNLQNETALFNPDLGDKLVIGSTYYFDKPGDNTTATQGWNSIYLGQNEDGSHRFWSASIGEVPITFNDDGSWTSTGRFKGYYFGAAIADPNIARLEAWDNDNSVV